MSGGGGLHGEAGVPTSPTPAPDLGSSPRGRGSLTSPTYAPSFLSGRMRQGISTPFWKVQKVNEGNARNSILGVGLLGREEPGSGLRAKGGVGDNTYGHGADSPLPQGHSRGPLSGRWPQNSF